MASSRSIASVARNIMRADFLVLLVLGIGFWTGHLVGLVSLHMALGVLFVLALWTVAGSALAARVAPGLAAFALIWGLVMGWLGAAQTTLMAGDLHWIVRVCHLVVAMIAMPIAERLTARITAGR